MTMQFDANFIPATFAEAIYRWKEHLKSVGWTIQASGDGLAAVSIVGDVITGFGVGANGLENKDAWFVIKKPDDNHELCFQRGPDNLNWQVLYSILAPGFTVGAPSPTVHPTAADQHILAGAIDPPDVWADSAPMTIARSQAAVATLLDGRIIVAGGWNNFGVFVSDVEIYNPLTNTWATVAPMPNTRSHAGYAVLPNGKFLVAGGYCADNANAPTTSATVYDPVADSWTATGAMSTPRVSTATPEQMNNCCILITAGPHVGNVIFCPSPDVSGGVPPDASTSEIYNVAGNTWGNVATKAAPYPAYDPTVVRLADGRIFEYNCQDSVANVGCSMWTPATNTWAATADIPFVALHGRAIQLTAGPNTGSIMVIGGWQESPYLANTARTQVYDPTTDTWTLGPVMGNARSSFAFGFTATGNPIVVGGAGGYLFMSGYILYAEELDQLTMTWKLTGSMSYAMIQLVGLTLPSSNLGSARFIVLCGSPDENAPLPSFNANQVAVAGATTSRLARYPDGKQTFSIAADDAAPFGFWAGGYGYNINDWFRAGGAGQFTSDGTVPSYESSPDALSHSPSSRVGHVMAYNRDTFETVMWGGSIDGASQHIPLETWVWNGDYWRALTTKSTPPRRMYAQMGYDNVNNKFIMFGGLVQGGTVTNETWEFNGVDTWTQLFPATVPTVRINHRMAFSIAAGRIIMFGGNTLSGFLNDTWAWTGTDWLLLHSGTGTAPGGRGEFGMAAIDPGGTILVYGGNDGGNTFSAYNDTWSYSIAGNTWTNVTPLPQFNINRTRTTIDAASNGVDLSTSTGPIYVTNHLQPAPVDLGADGLNSPYYVVTTAGLESLNHTGISGNSLSGNPGGTGFLATGQPVFAQLSPGRWKHNMVYDAATGKVVMFGGYSPFVGLSLNDTWEWNGSTWTLAMSALQGARAPLGRRSHAMAYDFNRGQIVMWGGDTFGCDSEHSQIGSTYPFDSNSNITWIRQGSTWTRKRSAPLTDGGSRMVYDSVRDRTVWFGGKVVLNAGGQVLTNHLWEFDCSVPQPAWQPVYALNLPALNAGSPPWNSPGPIPIGRCDHSMAFDAGAGVTVMFGGVVRPLFTDTDDNETWTYNGTAWTNMAPATSPSARSYSAMAYDPINTKTVLYGGTTGTNETWTWNGVTWTQLFPALDPGARTHHCMAYYPGVGVVLYGGDGASVDTWVWNGTTWSALVTATNPGPYRQDASLIYNSTRNGLMLVGGIGYQDTWFFDNVTMNWTLEINQFPFDSGTTGPHTLTYNNTSCAAYDSTHDRAVFYSDKQTWYTGYFNGGSSGFIVFDPIKNPLPGDPDPFVIAVSQFFGAGQETKNDMNGLLQLGNVGTAWSTFGTPGLPFDANGERFRRVVGSVYTSYFGELAPGGLNLDPVYGGGLARLLPLLWMATDGCVKGESSLIYMPTLTFGYGGIAISTGGEASRDLIGIRAGFTGEGTRSLAFPWNGSSPLFSDDKLAPGSGNIEAFSGAFPSSADYVRPDWPNSLKTPVEEVRGVKFLSVGQAELIDDGIPTQEPLATSGGGSSGSGLLIGSPILHGGS